MNSFYQQKSFGKNYEQVVKQHLQKRNIKVIDVAENSEWQKKDIDFIIQKEGKTASLEIKADSRIHSTNNFFFEIGALRGNARSAGWLEKCQADYLCVYDTIRNHGYILNLPLTSSLLEQQARKTGFYDRLDKKYVNAYLFKLETARKNNCVVYEWQD